ncbi:MAG: hypothetical protein DU429_05000 [Candidatus Tokpelaia sp.]|nr:MAG: hypothetical protein DU430_00990 [Candidatus Tokpelaia sp.]KAA6206980.1 MAG: hypothetical protein DU429_05000 [Candidatus Tokpelaia sp.]KAA6405566.1 hypothetical protein DPQ22_04505 [Candidatus Tokpelaia sp.]
MREFAIKLLTERVLTAISALQPGIGEGFAFAAFVMTCCFASALLFMPGFQWRDARVVKGDGL